MTEATQGMRVVGVIDLTPKWVEIVPTLRLIIENGKGGGTSVAWAEIERMAALADERNEIMPKYRALQEAYET